MITFLFQNGNLFKGLKITTKVPLRAIQNILHKSLLSQKKASN